MSLASHFGAAPARATIFWKRGPSQKRGSCLLQTKGRSSSLRPFLFAVFSGIYLFRARTSTDEFLIVVLVIAALTNRHDGLVRMQADAPDGAVVAQAKLRFLRVVSRKNHCNIM